MGVKGGSSAKKTLSDRFDGWQPGLLAVLVAWSAAVLVVPRPAPPRELPEPLVAPADLGRIRASQAALSRAAQAHLPDALRALGGAVRRLGRAEASRDATAMGAARRDIEERMMSISGSARGRILELRAYQADAFVAAVRRWEATGEIDDDFVELGGDLVGALRRAGWCSEESGRPRVAMDDDELGVAYRKRWNVAVGAPEGAHVSLAEERLLFAFAIRHPRQEADLGGDAHARAGFGASAMLRRIDEHAKVDPDYPAELARGVIHYHAGNYSRAVVSFQRFREAHPDGPYAARAASYARAAAVADAGDDPDAGWL
jgi:hypothetical protein